MELQKLPVEFVEALPILKKIKTAGYEAYFVGGSVRDALLKRPIHDVDIATSAYPEEIKSIFERTVDVSIEHGTVLVLEHGREYEITTFRTEDVYVDYRRPSHVSFVRSLKEDLKRRDFTVNALALDEKGRVIDLFDGLSDLKNHLLKAVGEASERFCEDALRIMRGIRFAASLNFKIEEKTLEAMKQYACLLEKISVERSFIEFDKLLLAPHWSQGISILINTRAYEFLPSLQDTNLKWEKFSNCIHHDFSFKSSEQAWTAVIIVLEIAEPKLFLKRWKTSVHFQKTVSQMVKLFFLRQKSDLTKAQVYHFGVEMIKEVEVLRQAFGLDVDFQNIDKLNQSLTIHHKHEIVVNGDSLIRELNFKPGPQLGQILSKIEQAIIDGELSNNKEAIFNFVKKCQ